MANNEFIRKIYKITFPGGEVYIGQTTSDLDTRWGWDYDRCVKMKQAIEKYGKHNPQIKKEIILYGLSDEEANYWETYYIAYYREILGYDMVLNEQSGGTANWKQSEETKKRISESGKQRYIDNPDLAKNHSEYMKQHIKDNPEWIERFMKIREQAIIDHPELKKVACKKILQYSYDMKYMNSFDSLADAEAATGINAITISNCLTQPEKHISAGNCRWFYDDGKKYPIIYYRKHENKKVSVLKKDKKTGEILGVYDSISEAAKVNNIEMRNISACINNPKVNKSAGGFIWERSE